MGAFEAVLDCDELGRCLIVLPFDPKAEFGRSRPPVTVAIDRLPRFSTTVDVHEGSGYLELPKGQVSEWGLTPGQRVTVEVEVDHSAGAVEVPADLSALLDLDCDAATMYEALSPEHQRDYVRWITDPEDGEERAKRLSRTIEMLRDGVTTPV